ncbi:hypothetical protein [Jannaschia pohangensis]|uniref:hypothetical protein n=1 Tax=Jannaschia pohangensis TaxID=390807 RepID=UPI0011140F30|nr:hypothetical protein [Jannaschia pohangensis]
MKNSLRAGLVAMTLASAHALPASAQDSCPVAADLAKGIVLTYADGSVETMRRLDADRVETIVGPDYPAREISGRGLYLLRSADFVGGKETNVLSLDYNMSPGDLPAPEAGMDVTIPVSEAFDGSIDLLLETYVGGPAQDVKIGGCTYSAIDIKLTRNDGTAASQSIELLRYYPDLGFANVYGLGDAGQPLDYFEVTEIEALR